MSENESLILAAVSGQAGLIDLILDAGADINTRNHNQKTPLMIAASNEHVEFVATLIDYGAKVNLQDINGNTALMHAIFAGNPVIVLLLLQGGANPYIRNCYDEAAMDVIQPGFEASDIHDILANWSFDQKTCETCKDWNLLTAVCERLGPPNYRTKNDTCTEE